jgi:hypothetical protein
MFKRAATTETIHSSSARGVSREAVRYLAIGLPFAFAALLACSSGSTHATGSSELPPDCTAFVAKYEACISSSVPSLPAIAKERAAQTRDALEQEAKRASAGASAMTAMETLAAKCRTNMKTLAGTCAPASSN